MVAAVSDNPLDNSLDNLIDNPSGNSMDNSLDNPIVLDLIDGMEEGVTITAYRQGDYTDLCRGPHVETVKEPSLGLTLPDGKHLRVDYTYKITYETAKDKVGLKLSNSATLDRNGGLDTDDCVNNISIKDSTSATSSTSVPIKLNKLNLNNMNIQVQAGFNIYRYNADDNVWQVATEIREKDVSVGPHSYNTHIVSSSEPSDTWSGWTNATTQNIIDSAVKITTDDYYISLEKGVIYMLVEIEAPNPFIILNEPKFFTYGNEVTSEVAQAAKSALASVPGSFDLDVSSIDNINPSEIASMDVLKDGSAAAIYGTRGTEWRYLDYHQTRRRIC